MLHLMGTVVWHHQEMCEPGQHVVLVGARPGVAKLQLPRMELGAHSRRVIAWAHGISTALHVRPPRRRVGQGVVEYCVFTSACTGAWIRMAMWQHERNVLSVMALSV